MSAPRPPITVTLEFDPQEMSRRGRIGSAVQKSRHDARELTAPARRAFLDKFERDVDPGGVLPEAERRRRAAFARKAHFGRLARLSAEARRRGREPSDGPVAA